jgi:DnaK suppressor protein
MEEAYIKSKQQELLKKKEQLNKDIAKASKYQDIGDSTSDSAQEVEMVGKSIALETVFNQEKKEVEDALKRIEKGAYGLCQKCHQPINKLRLNAYPTARFCRQDSK